MRSVRPLLSREQAVRRLKLPGARRPTPAALALPHLELLGLPCFRVEVEAEGWGGRRRATYLVDAVSGGAVRLRGDVDWSDEPLGGRLEPRISAEQAVAETRAIFARGALLAKWARPRLVSIATPERVGYPYWVGYYERRPGRLDVRAVDGVTGRGSGAAVRRSLLLAFVDALAHTA